MSSQKLSLSPRPSGTIYQDLSLSGFRGRGEPVFRSSNPSRLFVCEAMEGRMLLSAVVHIASDLVAISAPVTASITGYTLVNADADTDIGPLTEGMTLDLSKLPRGLNVRANTTGPAKSVRLTFDNTKRLELQAPWALFGDWFGDYVAGSLGDGSHTITAQAFTGTSGSGTSGPLNILHIRVINQPPVAPLILIQGTVYNDVNASKTRDAGDTPLAGVKVYVDFNMDGTLDAGEPTAVTDSSGTYRFGGLLARSYVVAQVVPIGYRQLVPAAPYGQRIYAPPGGTRTVAPFADHLNSGVLSGTIYKDLNLSGLRSPGEPGLAGIRAYLDLNKDGIWQGSEPSVLSATDGSYRFTGLAPG